MKGMLRWDSILGNYDAALSTAEPQKSINLLSVYDSKKVHFFFWFGYNEKENNSC